MAAATCSRAAPHGQPEEAEEWEQEASPASELGFEAPGAQIAAALLRLGKLRQPTEELLVIEVADERPACPRTPRQAAARSPVAPLAPGDAVLGSGRPPLAPRRRRTARQEAAAAPVVENDMIVLDYDSETEVELTSLPVQWAPGSTEGRRLMQSRAQQCVVCMEEKEHTFVPPHREEPGHHVDSHRFCTDCWQEFLQHGLQRARTTLPPPLTCPLCRVAIEVPDVWGVNIDLPVTWTEACAVESGSPEASPAAVAASGLWGRLSAEPSSFWADAAPGATSDAASPGPSVFEEECSPMAEAGGPVGNQRGRDRASRWRALSCPVPNWQTGSYLRRLYDALAGTTLVESVGLGDEFRVPSV